MPQAPSASQAVVPTVFRWEHGGNQVQLTGTFNNWSARIPMHRSGNDFVFIVPLPPGQHAYKFVVDEQWRYAPDQPTVTDAEGNVNNVIDLSGFKPDNESPAEGIRRRDSPPHLTYAQAVPDEDEYGKEPPLLPPHLRTILLNHPSPDPFNPDALPVPLPVTLHHLCCTAIKDNMMVQATSHRYRRKFVTCVYYSLTPTTPSMAADVPLDAAGNPSLVGPTAMDVAQRVAATSAALAGASAAAGPAEVPHGGAGDATAHDDQRMTSSHAQQTYG